MRHEGLPMRMHWLWQHHDTLISVSSSPWRFRRMAHSQALPSSLFRLLLGSEVVHTHSPHDVEHDSLQTIGHDAGSEPASKQASHAVLVDDEPCALRHRELLSVRLLDSLHTDGQPSGARTSGCGTGYPASRRLPRPRPGLPLLCFKS